MSKSKPKIIHYRMSEGVYGYQEGDILVDDESGVRSRVVRTGAGIQLEPDTSIVDVAFDAYTGSVSAIRCRLAPIDVGFDLRALGISVTVEQAPTMIASYARRKDGERRVIEGPTAEVVARLRKEGYHIVMV